MKYQLGHVYVAEGSTLYLTRRADGVPDSSNGGATYLASLSGAGLVTNTAAYGIPLFFNKTATNTFTGVIGGGAYVQITGEKAEVNLANANNTWEELNKKGGNGFVLQGNDSTVGLLTMGAIAEVYPYVPSSSGFSDRFYINGTNVTIRNLNTEKQYCGKTMILKKSPLVLDAGAYGGITYTNWISGHYGSSTVPSEMHHLILTGDNSEECIFSPVIRCWSMACTPATNDCTLYITKRGTGTYYFKGVTTHWAGTSDWRGGLSVENGTVKFDSVAEAGDNSSLGKATMLQEPYVGMPNPIHDVNYAISLGGAGTTGWLAYCGTAAARTTTRPIAVYSDGGLMNNSAAALAWQNISAREDGATEKTFRLGGTSQANNSVIDIKGEMNLAKDGTGTWYVMGDVSFTGRVTVAGGKLVVHGGPYSYYKWVGMQCWGVETDGSAADAGNSKNAYGFNLQEFALFDANGLRVNTGFTQAADETNIGPGEAAFTDAGNGYTYSPANTVLLPRCFNDSIDSAWWVMPQTVVRMSNSKSYISLTMHLAEGTQDVRSYDFVTCSRASTHPSRWKMYGSYDGKNWCLIDDQTQTEQLPPMNANGAYLANYWAHKNADGNNVQYVAGSATTAHTTGYPLAEVPEAFQNVTDVRVCAGAELMAEGAAPTLKHLTIDANDGGDIKNFSFAANGTLTLENVVKSKTAVALPGNYGTCSGLSNLANWEVTINGRPTRTGRIRATNGKLEVLPEALIIMIR